MSQISDIEWTESTWNPITGCSKISDGCKNCYAERIAYRLKEMGQAKYRDGFMLRLHPEALKQPLIWKKPRMVFVNSMSDMFHEEVPVEFIQRMFEIMRKAYWHTFQILTKRSDRLLELDSLIDWSDNVWMGVSVENSKVIARIQHIKATSAKTKFISFEPLLGSICNLDLTNIDWAIVGGESGPGARPMKNEWVRDIKDTCDQANVPFFFKQWGGVNKKKNGRVLLGKTWDARPETKHPTIFSDSP
jgi:protein gp37